MRSKFPLKTYNHKMDHQQEIAEILSQQSQHQQVEFNKQQYSQHNTQN